jgi:hypothetical protein
VNNLGWRYPTQSRDRPWDRKQNLGLQKPSEMQNRRGVAGIVVEDESRKENLLEGSWEQPHQRERKYRENELTGGGSRSVVALA